MIDPLTRPPEKLTPEKVIESRVCTWAKNHGILPYKFTSPGQRSVPDRLFVLPGGRVVFIEFKRAGRKPTPRQYTQIEKLKNQGATVTWLDNEKLAIIFLESLLEEEQQKRQGRRYG